VVGERVIEVLRVIWIVGATRPRHLPWLDEERRLRKKFVAATVVKVKVRIDHMGDVRRSHAYQRELAHHIVADLRADGKSCGPALA
jgi:hypothetical protein